jgi:hypothetical protein
VAGSNYEVNIKLDVRKINQQLSNLERRIKKLNEIAMGQRGAGKTVLKTERDKLAVATRTFRKEQQITREKQKQSRIENQTTRNINARNVARSAGKPKATTPVATGGGGGGIVSGALISGAFPLLFGQGLVGGAAGFGGGLLGGAIGGQTGGFAGGLVATALLTLITEAIEFRKEVEKVNDVIERTGGTSRITAGEITSLAKRMKVTKEEALQAANAFAAFGAQSSLALAETFKDRSTFNLYANLNKDAKTFITTVDTLFQKNELGIDQAKRSLKVLQTKGLEEASIYAEAIKNEQEIRKELEETKPSEADKRKADAMFKTYFDPQTLLPLQNFILLNEKAQKQVLKLITNEGQLEARLGTVEERFKKRLDLVKKNIEAQREFNESVRRALIIQAPKDELKKLLDPLLQVDALGKSIGASFSESFKGIVKGSMTAQDALRNLFMRTADHFLDMAAQILAAQIRSGIFGLFKNFLNPSPSFKITGGPSITTPSGTNIGKAGFMPSNPPIGPSVDLSKPDNYNQTRFGFGKAMGGPVTGGTSYIVGERGPEMFSPGVSGMITPNHALGGSTNVIVNVDASGSSVEGDEQQGRELGRLISVAVQSELVQQKRPGGLLA